MTIVEWLYQLLILMAAPLVGTSFLFSPRGKVRLRERFGLGLKLVSGDYIWVHGASLGELRGALPLIQRIKSSSPECRLLVTATTPTGFKAIDLLEKSGDQGALKELNIYCRLLPFDHELFFSLAFRGVRISAIIIAETEIWPGLFLFARRRGIPISMVNARISDYTIASYRRVVKLMPNLFSSLATVLVADTSSLERFQSLGAKKVRLTGNMKYDTQPSVKSDEQRQRLRDQLPFHEAPILILGSLRPGEELEWFKAIRQQRAAGADFGCIVAPRHKEKFEYFADALRKADIAFWRFSERTTWPTDARPDVILLDTFGMLEPFYSVASLVFIGATLVDIGGHNPLEAAAYGVPIVMGPYDSTVREVTEQLDKIGALIRIAVGQTLEPLLSGLTRSDNEMKKIGVSGQEVWRVNQGATDTVWSELRKGCLSNFPDHNQEVTHEE